MSEAKNINRIFSIGISFLLVTVASMGCVEGIEAALINVIWRTRSDDNSNISTYTITIGPIRSFDSGSPVKDASVTARINGTKYTSHTDENGIALFHDIPWPVFPNGTQFTAKKKGFLDASWKQREELPIMGEDVTATFLYTLRCLFGFGLIIGFVVIVILLVRRNLLKRKKKDD